MPIAARTFRVFVSSTFEDLKEERDALQRHVFPQLRTLCEQHGARFQAIDLRWGVRDEAGLDQQTMEICLRGEVPGSCFIGIFGAQAQTSVQGRREPVEVRVFASTNGPAAKPLTHSVRSSTKLVSGEVPL